MSISMVDIFLEYAPRTAPLARVELKDGRLSDLRSTEFGSVRDRIEREIRSGKHEGDFLDYKTRLPFSWRVLESDYTGRE